MVEVFAASHVLRTHSASTIQERCQRIVGRCNQSGLPQPYDMTSLARQRATSMHLVGQTKLGKTHLMPGHSLHLTRLIIQESISGRARGRGQGTSEQQDGERQRAQRKPWGDKVTKRSERATFAKEGH